jgi:DNA transposition AAA+ family ATPase
MPPTRFPAFQDDLDLPEPEDGSHINLDDGSDPAGLDAIDTATAAPIAIVDTTHDRINIAVETVAAAAALYSPEEAALVIWSHKYALDHKWSMAVAQRQYRLHSTVLSRVWQGKYRQPPNIRPPGAPRSGKVHRLVPNPLSGQLLPLAGFCKRIAAYKEVADARGSETRLPFIETSTFRKIKHLAETAIVSNDLSQLIGESQIGKTTACKEIARRNPHVIHVQVPAASTSSEFIKEIGAAMHICDGNQFRTLRRIKARLNEQNLLILDRLHFIFETYTDFQAKRVLGLIQEIFDDTGCALLISATKVFLRNVQREKFVETFKQISRRGVRELNLGTEPAPQDIDAILAHYGLALPPASAPLLIAGKLRQYNVREVIQTLARTSGLGKLTRYLADIARVIRSRSNDRETDTPLTWESFIAHYDIIERAGKEVGK